MPLSLFLLGPPRVEIDGEAIAFPRQKSLALLAHLAVTGEQQRRDSLAALLWPESEDARGALRRELSSLKSALGDGDWLAADRENISLSGDVRLDVDDFLAAVESGDPARLTQADSLYRGDFLTGFSLADAPDFDDWRFFQSEEYRRLLAGALERLVAHHQTAGDPAAAIPYARRLLALDNLHEPAHRGLMRLYALAGQQAAALRQYEECLRLLDEELGVPPEAETTELHEAIRTRRFAQDDRVTRRQGDTPTSPPHPVTPSPGHPVTPSPGHNLPPQATPFVGRQREVEAVLALLAAPNARLVTITGVGGIGKSRLGLAVAEALLTDFPDGVWFVPLAQVEAADGVPAAIAAALSAPSGGEPRSSLIAFLREKKALLLLDNFEHLLDAADFLAEVLPDAPGVKVLVTSQERLNLLEESLYPLAGLSLEGEGAASSALTLFEQTARRVQPDFSLNKEKSAVTAICQAVEGMPLGIELAAGWVRVMSCAEIAAEIQRGVDFLSTTLRNLPPRHRSLRAVFARSWALLDPDEQNLLARLSVFQGGFTRQAGAEVADATPRQLAGLMDHSFLRRQAGERFDMHGLMHRFAGEKLAAQPAIEADARQRHADFYADLMAQAGWELEPGDAAVSAALEGEAPNFLAAWRRGVENRDASVVGRMMRWLVDYFRRRGDYRGGEAAFASAVQAFRSTDGEAADAGLLGSLLLRLGKCIHRDREEVGLAVEREAVALLRRAAPAAPLDLAQALTALGMSHASLGHNPEATELATEALALLREIGNEVGVGATLRDIGYVAIGWGRPREAQRYIEESVHVLEGREHKSYVQSTYGLGLTLLMRGHYRRARALLRRALPYFVEQGENGMAGYTDRSLAELYTATGDFASARHHFSETFARFEPVGIGYEVTNSMYLSPAALARLADEADAEAKLLDALATARRVGYGQPIATSLHHLARLRHDQRDYEGALALLDEALSVARKIDFRYATALVLTAQGHSLLALKQTNTARAAYAEALEIADAEGIDRIVCDGLTGIAQLAQLRGDSQLALSLLHFVHIHEASEWETKRRAERLMADLPRTETHTPIPSLEEAIRLARVARDDRVTRRPGDTPTSPPHPVTPSPGHLPVPTTSFIGREGELSELSALLARPDVRLATVVAPGGMGKTRFAIEAARRLAGDFPDGVWFLSLVGVNEASQMLAALVQLLDAPMGAGGAKEAVQRFLARRRLLLVLDNFEQLVDSAEVLAEIVQGAPDVKVLVTSRVRLNLREEWAFPLTGLGMESVVTDDTVVLFVGPNEAIRLFAERARQMQPGFDAATEAEAVAAICRTVEGMPLGIELAASWLRAMKCGEIAAEIRRDVDFLSTPLRNVPEQHRSMRAVFERSWALLTPNEQRGLARLSVFQGGFTRAAAEAVAEVRLPLLSALVDHSLLRHGASGRYDIHELLRQFAAEQLAKSGEAESIRDKHAICFFGYLSQRREALQWRQMQPALDELIPERENLFAGWRWSCEQGHFSGLREAATLLPLYCNLTNAREGGWQLFAQAIAAVEEKAGIEDDRPGLLGLLRFRQQVELRNSHMQPEAYLQRLLETRALLLESKADNREELARLSGAIGTQVATVGRGEEGAAWMEDAIRILRETGNLSDLGKIYHRFALLRAGEGKVHLADETFGKVAEAWRQAKLPPYPIVFRAIVYHMQGRWEEMRHTWEQARTIEADPFCRGFSMGRLDTIEYHLGEAGVALGTLDEAAIHFQRARAIYETQGQLWQVALGFQYSLGSVLRLQGQMEAARRQIEWEVATVREVGFKQRIATRLHELARLEYDEGHYAESEAALAEALAIAESIKFLFVEALVLCQMGHTAAAQGKPGAADYYRRALEIADEQGMNGIVVDVLLGVGQLAAAAEKDTEAGKLLSVAASHPNGDWETKQRAKRQLAALPPTGQPSPIPSLEEAVHLARAALDDRVTRRQSDTPTSPPHPVTPSPGHLPVPTTSFIGREGELSELSALLVRPDVRLATVVAPGGMGKTRFAIEAARRLAGNYPDGVWFLSLVGVYDVSQMLSALVELFDLPRGQGDARVAIRRFLASRHLLLVLDNFEQLAPHADVLAEIVQNAPDADLLVTSRTRLNLQEEWLFPLEGLATEGGQAADEQAESGAAIRLFVERARQMQPGFDPICEAETVSSICQAVEGMPLGIELAASWLRAMSCAEIVAEIGKDVDFLSTSLRNVPAQHRSMRAVFERSWGLLTPEGQRGLARLSVFQGGFTRKAAADVADVRLPLLSALIDQSLLRHSATGRYDSHELLRQFAAEQLAAGDDAQTMQARHARYFLELLADRTDDLQWRAPRKAASELSPDRGNIFAAWHWAVRQEEFELLSTGATALLAYSYWISARLSVLPLFEEAMQAAEKAGQSGQENQLFAGKFFWPWVHLSTFTGGTEAFQAALERVHAYHAQIAAKQNEESAVRSCYFAMIEATLGRNEEARRLLWEGLDIFQKEGNLMRLGWAYSLLALLESGRGRPLDADRFSQKAVTLWQQAGCSDAPQQWRILPYLMQGRFPEAEVVNRKILSGQRDPFVAEIDSSFGEPFFATAGIAVSKGQLEQAIDLFEKAITLAEEEEQPWVGVFGFRHTLGGLFRLLGDWDRARPQIEREVAGAREADFSQRIATRLHELARLEFDLGNYPQAEAPLSEALEIALRIDFLFAQALVLCQMGHTAGVQMKPEAAGHYRRALDIAAEQGMNLIVLDVLLGAARLIAAAGDVTQAVEWLALAVSHPNAEWETKQKAQKALASLRAGFSPSDFQAAEGRGRLLSIEEAINLARAALGEAA